MSFSSSSHRYGLRRTSERRQCTLRGGFPMLIDDLAKLCREILPGLDDDILEYVVSLLADADDDGSGDSTPSEETLSSVEEFLISANWGATEAAAHQACLELAGRLKKACPVPVAAVRADVERLGGAEGKAVGRGEALVAKSTPTPLAESTTVLAADADLTMPSGATPPSVVAFMLDGTIWGPDGACGGRGVGGGAWTLDVTSGGPLRKDSLVGGGSGGVFCRAGDRIQCLGAAAAVLAALATRPDWHRTRVVFLNGRAKASMAREVLGLLEVRVEPAGRASGVGEASGASGEGGLGGLGGFDGASGASEEGGSGDSNGTTELDGSGTGGTPAAVVLLTLAQCSSAGQEIRVGHAGRLPPPASLEMLYTGGTQTALARILEDLQGGGKATKKGARKAYRNEHTAMKKGARKAYRSVLLFTGDKAGVRSAEDLGATAVHTPRGLTWQKWRQGLKLFAQGKNP